MLAPGARQITRTSPCQVNIRTEVQVKFVLELTHPSGVVDITFDGFIKPALPI
jgi:hypothetical protein